MAAKPKLYFYLDLITRYTSATSYRLRELDDYKPVAVGMWRRVPPEAEEFLHQHIQIDAQGRVRLPAEIKYVTRSLKAFENMPEALRVPETVRFKERTKP